MSKTQFRLIKKRSKWARLDLIIFLILYPLTIIPSVQLLKANYISADPVEPSNGTFAFITDHLDVPALEPYTFKVLIPFIVIGLHVLIKFFSIWFINFRIWLEYYSATPEDATLVAFFPPKHHGSPEIVQFNRQTNPPSAIFQQKKREFIDGSFRSLQYPVNLKVSDYLTSEGLSDSEVNTRTSYFGLNTYDIPTPSFLEIYKEQISSPLFVFQIFSILCWLFDEYFTYPLISLFSLFIVEANTANTRQSNMLELRGVKAESAPVRVRRNGQWQTITSDKLVPGDLLLITSCGPVPADLILLSGRVIVNEAMLTGESTPQVKESIANFSGDRIFDISKDKRHIAFSGTNIEQFIPAEKTDIYIDQPGCLAYVCSTGLGSAQGRLIRTILFASERVAAESKDSTRLLLFLTIFAIAASGYVIYYGKSSTTISSFRLIVEAITIITSSIPPDLPMELTFAVNASLLALSKLQVFCTEPFRIPFAGSVSVCCFDKTGTITDEKYELLGIDEMTGELRKTDQIVGSLETQKLSTESLMVIGSCHSLVQGTHGQLIGDSLEAAAFSKVGFNFTPGNKAKRQSMIVQTLKSFHFSAEFARMSTIGQIQGSPKQFVLAKGAPEAIAKLLETVPEGYHERYRNYTRQGCRVLALATKQLPTDTLINSLTREAAESKLVFCGFAVFQSPFKRGSEDTIAELLRSTHRVIIITGDHPLTACHIAQKVNLLAKPPAIIDDTITTVDDKEITGDLSNYSLCYTGQALKKLSQEEYDKAIRKCNVFARMEPQAKAKVVSRLKELGERVMMCGDGTNDVDALKHADVGVGLLENSVATTINEDEYKPKLGAASIAAPFVSKRSTISACIDLIRFGRATLSSTIDIFKQLSVNCLVSAYTMSVLFLQNVKFGDRQMTIFSLVYTVAFMSLSWAKPLRKLSTERPFESQFNAYLVFSVLSQSLIHLILFVCVQRLVYSTGFEVAPFDYKVKFSPSLMNTAMFIAQAATTVSCSLSNYRGQPFMQGFFQNKLILGSFVVSLVLLVLVALNDNPLIKELFELVEYPDEHFRKIMVFLCIFDVAGSFIVEKVVLFFFSWRNRQVAKGLVDPEVAKLVANYEPKNDDVLEETVHQFGLKDMFKQNLEIQKKMAVQRMVAKQDAKLSKLSPAERKKALQRQQQIARIKAQNAAKAAASEKKAK